jgi:ferrous iron transport protein A
MSFDGALRDRENEQEAPSTGAPATARPASRSPRVSRSAAGSMALDCLPLDCPAEVVALEVGASGEELPARLAELGFLPGERVRLIARLPLGGPLAVRIGTGTFALRREEAACVRVTRCPAGS